VIPPRNPKRPATIQEEGWAAHDAGKNRSACPYTGSNARAAWMRGYDAAECWFANE
jgi:ribosome modulation factor